jgi:hypothetical protein
MFTLNVWISEVYKYDLLGAKVQSHKIPHLVTAAASVVRVQLMHSFV